MSRKDGGDASRGGGSSSRGTGGSGSSSSDGPPVSREEFLQLFAAIGDMKGQLSSMKRDLSQDRADATIGSSRSSVWRKSKVLKRRGTSGNMILTRRCWAR